MKKVLIDCGTNLCQGLGKISEFFGVDDSWEVWSFEANTNTFNVVDHKSYPHVNFVNKAVWIDDSIRTLDSEVWEGEIHKKNGFNIKADTITDSVVGGGTNIMGDEFLFPNSKTENIRKNFQDIQCFDFSSFIKEKFNEKDLIVVKMDIEGAEYPVLEKMITDDSLKFIKHLFVEWHNPMLKTQWNQQRIVEEINKLNIKLYNWD